MLKSVHADFYADGVTVMDTSSELLLGRPLGALTSCGVNPLGIVYKYTSITTAEFWQSNRIMVIASCLLLIYTCLVMTGQQIVQTMTNSLNI